ncbi:MAG: carboxypeptidase-like regulatory domain-containing protein, partial [Bacteroidota bacterium]
MNTANTFYLKTFCLILFIGQSLALSGQNLSTGMVVQGRILNKETNQPIPFAGIMNNHLLNATISDMKGYFKISVSRENDTLFASCIGFKKQMILLSEKKTFYTVYLEQNIQLLNEVTISPADDSYLYDLLSDCKKNASSENRSAKAYYEIKSYAGDDQIEMLESFFNADLNGYDLSALELKTGRFALKKMGNTFFNSLESSRAIV